MTDITDQDRRSARGWATMMDKQIAGNPDARAAARVILATVEAPPLSEDLAHVTENWQEWATEAITTTLAVATDLAKQMEHDLTEARAEVERLTAERDGAREEIAWLRNGPGHTEVATYLPNPADVQKGAESTAESLDPADVPPGEVWLVEVYGEKRNAVKDGGDCIPWNTINGNGRLSSVRNADVTLIARLLPAPRDITNPKEEA